MKKIFLYTCAAMLSAGAMLPASCSHENKIIGSWTASSPVSIGAEMPAAATATSLMTIDFMPAESGAPAKFNLSTLIEATQAVRPDTLALDSPYEVSVAATASVSGTWSHDGDEDILLAFDMNTLSVDVDPAGVAFSENMLTGAQQPAVDSLTARTAEIWKRQITNVFKSSLHRYSKLDDVEVTAEGTALKFEVKDITGRDRDVVMHRVINPE